MPDMTMDVELQILKHLKRDAQPTVAIIDQYCESYKDLFPEVGFKLGSAKAKVECKPLGFLPDFTETLYSGHGNCTVGSIDVTATLDVCIGGPKEPTIISYVGLKKGSAKVQSTSGTKCDLSPSSPISLGSLKDVLLPGFSSAVEDVIDPVLIDAIDDGLEELIPFSN